MQLTQAVQNVKDFAKLERVLAVLCGLTPLFLIIFSDGARESISAHYDMRHNQVFYFLLTAAVMLFLTNAFVKQAHMYNAVLAGFLSVVVLFNHDEGQPWHRIGTLAFFIGSALAIVLFSKGPGARLKVPFLVILVVVAIGLILEWYSTFAGEWVAMGVVAINFFLDAAESVPGYRAIERGDRPSLTA